MWKKVGAAALMLATAWPGMAQTDWRNQAVPVYPYPTYVRMQDTHWYAPRVVEYVRRVEALQQALDAHCGGGLAIPARQAWREALVAWDRLSTVAVGPLVERRSARSIDFQPARPELIEQAIAATAEGKLDMALVGSAARGFPALEWLLWAQPPQAPRAAPAARGPRNKARKPAAKPRAAVKSKAKAKPARRAEVWLELPMFAGTAGLPPTVNEYLLTVANKPKPTAKPTAKAKTKKKTTRNARRSNRSMANAPGAPAPGQAAAALSRTTTSPSACQFAQTLAADLHAEGLALAEGFAKRLEGEPDEAQISERLGESLNQWLGGLEQLRMQAVERPVLEMAADNPRARPALPRLLSGSSALDRQARWSALRTLAVLDAPTGPEPGTALIPLETLLRGQGLNPLADKLHEAAKAVDQALEAALDNTPDSLQATGRALAALHTLVNEEVAPALDVRIGFSDADGD